MDNLQENFIIKSTKGVRSVKISGCNSLFVLSENNNNKITKQDFTDIDEALANYRKLVETL
jgi:hypothetical protein